MEPAFPLPETFGIRFLQESDITLFVEWEKKDRPYPWSISHFSSTLGSATTKTLVFCENQDLVGYAVVQIVGEEVHLQNFCIGPAFRRQGLGEKLLQKVMMWCHSAHAKLILLDVDTANKPAIRLYQKLGFEVVEKRSHSYPRGEDAYLLRKYL